MSDVTHLLCAIEQGDPHAAEHLLPLVYEELRRLAAHRLTLEKPGQTLQATALVHEAYLRLVDGNQTSRWDSRGHFFAAAAEAMRRILVEQARKKGRDKRGGKRKKLDIDAIDVATTATPDQLPAIDDALARLALDDPATARLVNLRYFAGLSIQEAGEALGVSTATAYRHWNYARLAAQRAAGRRGVVRPPLAVFFCFSPAVRKTAGQWRIDQRAPPRRTGTMSDRPGQAKAIFLEAIEKHTPEQ
jgi:RNA polymerase sigma factor (TIGR02999 family)